MARVAAALKQSDLTRYAKALLAAGFEQFQVEVNPNGTHTIMAGKVKESQAGPDPDELLKK